MSKELTYLKAGEHLVPNLTLPKEAEIGKYGHLRKMYLKEHKEPRYLTLLMSGRLMQHLHETEQETKRQVEQQMQSLLEQNPAPPKAKGSLQWAQHMQMLKKEAEELVFPETIYS